MRFIFDAINVSTFVRKSKRNWCIS